MKWDAYRVLLRGGKVFILDTSGSGEWARAAAAFPEECDVQIIKPLLGDRAVLDPLRVFTADMPDDPEQVARLKAQAGQVALDYLCAKASIGTSMQDYDYLTLREAIETLMESDNPADWDCRRLLELVRTRGEGLDPTVKERKVPRYQHLTDLLEAVADSADARHTIFGSGPVVHFSADAILIDAPVTVPKEGASVTHLRPQERDGIAFIYLITAIMVEFATRDQRFVAVVLDEAHALSYGDVGPRMILNALRTLRKNVAALWLGSQITTDATREEFDDLIPQMWVGRCTPSAAAKQLALIGAAVTKDNLDTLANLPTGTFLRRDQAGRIGLVRGLRLPPDLYAAFHTSRRTAAENEERELVTAGTTT